MGMKCLECGTPIGAGTGIDGYKHTVACFHLQDVGADRLLLQFSRPQTDYERRVYEQLMALREE